MFILFSKNYFVLIEIDLKAEDGHQQTNRCLVFDMKQDSTEPLALDWPPAIVASSGDLKSKKQSSRIICGSVSPSEDYIALCDDNKNVIIFDRQFVAIHHFLVKRNCVKIAFLQNEKTVISCDKSGDIYEYDFSTSEQHERLLLGHCSMLLDFTIARDDQLIIRCDKLSFYAYFIYYNSFVLFLVATEMKRFE